MIEKFDEKKTDIDDREEFMIYPPLIIIFAEAYRILA